MITNSNSNFMDALNSYFATNEQVEELQKALTAYGNAEPLVPIEYDPEILSELYLLAPFLARLEATGRVTPTTTAKVAYRNKTEGVKTHFIAEDGEIPKNTDSKFRSEIATMSTIVTPLEISDMAQLGTQDVTNLRALEVTDALQEQAKVKDIQLITGNKKENKHSFDGLTNIIKTNTTDLKGKELTKDHLRTACQTIFNKGGTPTAILTTAEVNAHLQDELYPGIRYVNKSEVVPGITVNAFNAPNGVEIPIITDPFMPNESGKRECYILDESVLYVKDLMKPVEIPLAKTKLTESTVIAQFTTFFCRAEQWQYKIGGIA